MRIVSETNDFLPSPVVDAGEPSLRERMSAPPSEPNRDARSRAQETMSRSPSLDPIGETTAPKMRPLKKLGRYLSALFKLGRIEWTAKQALRNTAILQVSLERVQRDLREKVDDLRIDYAATREIIEELRADRNRARLAIVELHRSRQDLEHRLEVAASLARQPEPTPADGLGRTGPAEASPTSATFDADPTFGAFLDDFRRRLENRTRGSRAEVTNRLKIHLPDVEAAVLRTGGRPAMDLGGDRDWLALLRDVGISAFGVDADAARIEARRREGLDLRLGDALAFLSTAETAGVSVISAFHLVERLPLAKAAWIAREAMRILAPGGLLLIEVRDTGNLLADTTDVHPDWLGSEATPDQLLSALLETAGCAPAEVRRLNPHERHGQFSKRPGFDPELARLLFGPRDVAVLGTKPIGG